MPSYAVTGAARGLGREFVNQLSADTANTIFALVRSKKTSARLIELAAERGNIHVFEADITDHKALKAAAEQVSKITGGVLDVLINNAALVDSNIRIGYALDGYPEGQESTLEADFRKSFDINVIGVIHTVNAFLPLLRAGNLKKVISLSTGVADFEFTLKSGYTAAGPYCVSKAALNMVIAKYAAEYADAGFTFLALSPGLVATAEEAPPKEMQEVYEAMGRKFAEVKPDMSMIAPEVSVKMMLAVVRKTTTDANGAFLSHYGNKEWL